MSSVFDFLKLLKPYDPLDFNKVRIGNSTDGGYVMVDDFTDSSALSFGVGNEVSWDNAMAERGIDVFLFDHTVEEPASLHKRCSFYKKGLTVPNKETEMLLSLETHLKTLNLSKEKSFILKVDVEGYEWEVFETLPASTLKKFRQIVGEFHFLEKIQDPFYRARYIKALKNITQYFHLVHVHANNYGSRQSPNISLIDGFLVPHALEITFIRKDRVKVAPSTTWFPTKLDAPCCARKPDICLTFFPFAPQSPLSPPSWTPQKPFSFLLERSKKSLWKRIF